MLWPFRGSDRGKAGRQHVAGMVRSVASQAIPRRDRARQLRRPRSLPVLRMRQDSEKRQEARRGAEILVPRMRALVQPADRDAVRLQEDPAVGMGGVPAPPLRVPLPQNVRPGQQKRRKHREILAYEGILRSGWLPRRGGSRGPGMARRDLCQGLRWSTTATTAAAAS